jgi:hypothetical protein
MSGTVMNRIFRILTLSSSKVKIRQNTNPMYRAVTEINLDTTQHNVKAIMHKTIQRHWKRSRLTMGRTPIAFSGQYKTGRTLIMSTGAITGRIQSTGRDKWGRRSYQSMIGRNGRIITIISVYQPVATMNNTDQGSCTVVGSTMMSIITTTDPIDNPRRAFRRDLNTFLNICNHTGWRHLITWGF